MPNFINHFTYQKAKSLLIVKFFDEIIKSRDLDFVNTNLQQNTRVFLNTSIVFIRCSLVFSVVITLSKNNPFHCKISLFRFIGFYNVQPCIYDTSITFWAPKALSTWLQIVTIFETLTSIRI